MRRKIADTMMRLALLALLLVASKGHSAPFAVAEGEGVRVTLTNEPCALQAVANMPFRATWEEGGKTVQGCFNAAAGIVSTYWDDRTVVVLPVSEFKRLPGI